VDNILDPGYLASLVPALAEAQLDYEIFYEIKANLTRAQVRRLAESGIRHVQPGIESFSSHVLALMRKGTRSSQNVNTLRWAQHYQVSASWNLLWGFPGETEQDYADQARVLHHLVHLQPPQAFGRVWLERFSPMFSDSEQFPTRVRRPEDSYRYVYPRQIDLDKVAYFFDYEFDSALPDSTYQPVVHALSSWQEAWHGDKIPRLTFRASPELVRIDDTRWPGNERTFLLRGGRAAIYQALVERPTTADAVRHDLGLTASAEALTEVFDGWQQDGLVWRDGDRTVALALPATPLR
jgi:ribosomal peptide maturation radical SAM protein 1